MQDIAKTAPCGTDAPDLLAACKLALVALVDLSEHPAFADNAPEFNHGGAGYVATEVLKATLAKAEA